MQTAAEFFNLYNHGFIRAAVGIPESRVADPAFNAARTVELMEQAWREKAVLILFPELGLSAYACDDLFHQQALLEGASRPCRPCNRRRLRCPWLPSWDCRSRLITCFSTALWCCTEGVFWALSPRHFCRIIASFMSCGSSPRRPGHA